MGDQYLKEFIIKRFVLDDDRLKDGKKLFGKDYFKELLERIRSIRANERRIYQQITDIFQECSIDYDKNSEITKNFYAMVQNRFITLSQVIQQQKLYISMQTAQTKYGLKNVEIVLMVALSSRIPM